MPKNVFQDMVVAKRAQSTPRPQKSKEEEGVKVAEQEASKPAPREPKPSKISKPAKPKRQTGSTRATGRKSRKAIWLLALVSLVFLFFAVSYMFSEAVVTVHPKAHDVVLDENLSASKNSNGSSLPFDLVVISGEEVKSVQGGDLEDVSIRATGTVVIYNSFSSDPQRLDIDTRLEGSNDKIYKIEEGVVVPGMEGSTPGSVEVGIYAALAGEDYNSDPLDFSIVGFQGTSKYSKFSARSKGPITGGLSGRFPAISAEQKELAVSELESSLSDKLFKKATDQIPEGFVLFPGAVFMRLDPASSEGAIDFEEAAEDNMLDIKLSGTLYGLLFNEQEVAKKIAENNETDDINEYDGESVYIPNLRDLAFSLSSVQTTPGTKILPADFGDVSFNDVKTINFNLEGEAKIVWEVAVDQLRTDLLGVHKGEFNQLLLQYQTVDSADLVLSPIWKMSLPEQIEDIEVFVSEPI